MAILLLRSTNCWIMSTLAASSTARVFTTVSKWYPSLIRCSSSCRYGSGNTNIYYSGDDGGGVGGGVSGTTCYKTMMHVATTSTSAISPCGSSNWPVRIRGICTTSTTSGASLHGTNKPEDKDNNDKNNENNNNQKKKQRVANKHEFPDTATATATTASAEAAADFSFLGLAPPSSAVPYLQLARLDKPIGSWLLFWPGAISIAMATTTTTTTAAAAATSATTALTVSATATAAASTAVNTLQYSADLLALFGIGAVLMRGAGCTVNDMWDWKYDALVARTAGRPLAAGTVTHAQATAFLGAQLLGGLAVLLQLNPYSIGLGAASLGLVVAYPLMKRVTYWPQAFLGIVFNWGALLGWAAVRGHVDWTVCAPLHASLLAWTIVYDTIYAHRDKQDDALVGVKSTALLFGDKLTKPVLGAFTAAMVAGLTFAGVQADMTAPYYMATTAATAAVAHQVVTVNLDDPADCGRKFAQSKYVGALLFAGALAGGVV